MPQAQRASLGPGDLVLCSGSFRWDAPLADRIRAASRAGFRGLSVWPRDYAAARGTTPGGIALIHVDNDVDDFSGRPLWPGPAQAFLREQHAVLSLYQGVVEVQ